MKDYGLLFYLSDDYSAKDVAALHQTIIDLASVGTWTGEPPEFIDDTQTYDSPEDCEEFRTVGGFLHLPTAESSSDRNAEKAYYHEVETIVQAMSQFSAATGCEIEFELGGDFVGDISKGEPSKLIKVGLLEEWRKAL